nr:unnamed protein product [Callosobruchus chinensis]
MRAKGPAESRQDAARAPQDSCRLRSVSEGKNIVHYTRKIATIGATIVPVRNVNKTRENFGKGDGDKESDGQLVDGFVLHKNDDSEIDNTGNEDSDDSADVQENISKFRKQINKGRWSKEEKGHQFHLPLYEILLAV